MNIFKKTAQKIVNKAFYALNGKSKRHAFQGANGGRLFNDWIVRKSNINEDLKTDLQSLQARSRDLVKNNSYAARFMKMVSTNVVGPRGIRLQMKIKNAQGGFDKVANDKIEIAWREWGRVGVPTMDGRKSWHDVENLVIKTIAKDGECLVRTIKGPQARNDFNYAVQVLSVDLLDINHNLPDQNIIMGVETNNWGRPIAYWMWERDPNTFRSTNLRIRIPAEEIIHLFLDVVSGQIRGIPWMTSSMANLKQLDGYMEAEVIAARVGASKMGFFSTPSGDGYIPDGKDERGNLVTEATPGQFEQLPDDTTFTPFDPQHPAGAFEMFVKTNLRAISSGFGVIYPSLANDLEGVNFSSIRHGALEERDEWRCLQRWFSEHLHEMIFQDWIKFAMLSGQIALPMSRLDKFKATSWQPRGWQWVDPKKDAEANNLMFDAGVKSRSMAAAELGNNFSDVTDELQNEDEILEEKGLKSNDEGSGHDEDEDEDDDNS